MEEMQPSLLYEKESKHCYLFIIFNGSVVQWKHYLLIVYKKKVITYGRIIAM